MKRKLLALLLIVGLTSTAAEAREVWLQWPVKCTVDLDCYVQSYVDHDPTTSMADYTCNSMTRDGHDGTDIRLASFAAMRAGVPVLAPANATVLDVVDTIEDKTLTETGAIAPGYYIEPGKECGNMISLRMKEGWVAKLCHLKRGSITVKPAQQVKSGQPIAEVGLSGDTDFPHLHIGLFQNRIPMDPFTRDLATKECNPRADTLESYGMWTTRQRYHPATMIGSGFLTGVPDKDKMRDKPESLLKISMNAPAITFWADLIGVRAGDVLQLTIVGPDGHPIADNQETVNRTLAQYFVYIGKRNSVPLLPGQYQAKITLNRPGAGAPIVQSSRVVEVYRE